MDLDYPVRRSELLTIRPGPLNSSLKERKALLYVLNCRSILPRDANGEKVFSEWTIRADDAERRIARAMRIEGTS